MRRPSGFDECGLERFAVKGNRAQRLCSDVECEAFLDVLGDGDWQGLECLKGDTKGVPLHQGSYLCWCSAQLQLSQDEVDLVFMPGLLVAGLGAIVTEGLLPPHGKDNPAQYWQQTYEHNTAESSSSRCMMTSSQ
jgi:hypothetical protein